MVASQWESLARGVDCPYDAPLAVSTDYWDLVAKLSIASLCLAKNQAYRGTCALIFDARHATRISELSASEWSAFSADLFVAERAIVRALHPDHVNIALLGNTIPHLHWGIIPRYQHDPRWGMSIWTTTRAEMADVRLSANEQQELIAQLNAALVV